ncbi:MAG: APC family permease [Candidatus Omnitrophica bacterium]|nr:APC family permease [Candidatus Omnitrophota bacterium]
MVFNKIKNILMGKALSLQDQGLAQRMSLIAFFAWVGLGADGMSSSCYGPEQAYLALQGHSHLSIFVAIASALTVFIISASYSQIIELFPQGGGGYLVASRLLSPNVGMVSGCALLIDYLLTIAISLASGTDALFSFLPLEWQSHKVAFCAGSILLLTFLNMRGVKESVLPLVPIFLIFIITHVFMIIYAIYIHINTVPALIASTQNDIHQTYQQIGLAGMIFLILKSYSIGAGTYTGIEAVSNGLPILREPRVKTGKRTMLYMSVSLAFTVLGLMLAYLIYDVGSQPGKTLNAVLFETISGHWGGGGQAFVYVSLLAEAFILFVAAQSGFLGGPRVLANMAIDRWFPTRFASLSDRLVTQKGVLLMGAGALITVLATQASVKYLVVLYSINVFVTFSLSQLGMVRYWWGVRREMRDWLGRISINSISLVLTTFILVAVVILKFHEGGWVTMLITGSLIVLAVVIKRHYLETAKQLRRLNNLVQAAYVSVQDNGQPAPVKPSLDSNSKTAVLVVNGFNGLGLHTLFNVIRLFSKEFKNFVFVQVGVVDAGNYKGAEDVKSLQQKVSQDIERYVRFMNAQNCYAESLTLTGTDVIDEVEKISPSLVQRLPGVVFFGGQIVFEKETFLTRWLHNYTVFSLQRRLYNYGIPFMVMPIRV